MVEGKIDTHPVYICSDGLLGRKLWYESSPTADFLNRCRLVFNQTFYILQVVIWHRKCMTEWTDIDRIIMVKEYINYYISLLMASFTDEVYIRMHLYLWTWITYPCPNLNLSKQPLRLTYWWSIIQYMYIYIYISHSLKWIQLFLHGLIWTLQIDRPSKYITWKHMITYQRWRKTDQQSLVWPNALLFVTDKYGILRNKGLPAERLH